MKVVLAFFFCCIAICGHSQRPIGNFTLPDVSGNSFSLQQYASLRAVVVLFSGNDCAFDNYYAARIRSLSEAYAGRVQFLMINSGIEPGESIDKMAAKARSRGHEFPYLADKDQVVMAQFGARKTPEVFLLRNNNGKFLVSYEGAIDDNPQVASDVKQNYLRDAIEKVLANQKIQTPLMRSAGCSIRRK